MPKLASLALMITFFSNRHEKIKRWHVVSVGVSSRILRTQCLVASNLLVEAICVDFNPLLLVVAVMKPQPKQGMVINREELKRAG